MIEWLLAYALCSLPSQSFIHQLAAKMRSSVLLCGFAAVSLALPSERHVVHETRLQDVGAKDMIVRHAADASAHIPFRVALKQKNMDIAEKQLLDVLVKFPAATG